MPEQKNGQNWTAGLKKASEAGGRGVVRRGKGAEERAEAQLIWILAMEGFSGKPTIASRRGDRDPVSPWQAVPSFSGRQFRPFVRASLCSLKAQRSPGCQQPHTALSASESFLQRGSHPGHVACGWESTSVIVELLGPPGSPDDTPRDPACPSPPSLSPDLASVSLGGACQLPLFTGD